MSGRASACGLLLVPCVGVIAGVLASYAVGCNGRRLGVRNADPSGGEDAGATDAGDTEAAAASRDDEGEPTPAEPSPALPVFADWRRGHDAASPCPPEMAFVERSFCIDRWEASLVEITTGGPRPFPHHARVEQRPVRAVSSAGAMPQAYVSGAEAQRACEMAGKRLCTDDEWWRACAGSRRTIYPYGTVHRKSACNEKRKLHPVVERFGADAGPDVWLLEPMNDPGINQLPGTLAPAGSHAGCVGPNGIHDMIGNVQEWTSDPAGTFHGGAYSTDNHLGCQYVTRSHPFGYHDYSTGFRCCSEPWGE
jgi:hypothetical protein